MLKGEELVNLEKETSYTDKRNILKHKKHFHVEGVHALDVG